MLKMVLLCTGCQSLLWHEVIGENVEPKVIVDSQQAAPALLAKVKTRQNRIPIDLPPSGSARPVSPVGYATELPVDGKRVVTSRNDSTQSTSLEVASVKNRQAPLHKGTSVAFAAGMVTDSRTGVDQARSVNFSHNVPSPQSKAMLNSAFTQQSVVRLPDLEQIKHEVNAHVRIPIKRGPTEIPKRSWESERRNQIPVTAVDSPPRLSIANKSRNYPRLTGIHSNSLQNRIRLKGISTDISGKSVVAFDVDQKGTLWAMPGRKIDIEDAQGKRTLVVSRITAESIEITDETTNEVILVR